MQWQFDLGKVSLINENIGFFKYSASRMEQDAEENVKVHLRVSSTPLLLLLLLLHNPGRNHSDQSLKTIHACAARGRQLRQEDAGQKLLKGCLWQQ